MCLWSREKKNGEKKKGRGEGREGTRWWKKEERDVEHGWVWVEKGKAGRKRWKWWKRKLAGVKKGNERRVERQQRGKSTKGSKAGEDNETKRYGSRKKKKGEKEGKV